MSLERYGLKDNPFNIVPNFNSREPIWAGFPDLKEQFEKRIKINYQIPNSSIILNWGEYGSGKTHAAKYFTHIKVLKLLIPDEKFNPFTISLNLPKGKNPIYELYYSIIDLLEINSIRDQFAGIYKDLENFIDSHFSNKFVKASLKLIFNSEIPIEKASSFLYGSMTASELKQLREYDIYRNIETENDISKILSGLFNCLIFERKIYSNIIFWIDEFEDITLMNNTNISKTSNFVREFFDDVPTGLLLLLNLTQTSFIHAEDLGEYLSDSVQSRIKQKINFPIPDLWQIKLYVKELLEKTREKDLDPDNDYFPFNEEIIEDIHNELDDQSIRKYNESLSLILELADLEKKDAISFEFYLKNKNEVF